MLQEQLLKLFYDLIILLSTLLATLAVAWLQKRIGIERLKKIENELKMKQELASMAVKFVEQVYRDLKGEEKYNKAAEWMVKRLQEMRIKITDDEIKGFIEAALRNFKDTFGEQWAKIVKDG